MLQVFSDFEQLNVFVRVRISSRRPAIATDILSNISLSLQENAEIGFKIGHDRVLPNPFQFIIHIHPTIPHYITYVNETALLNKSRSN